MGGEGSAQTGRPEDGPLRRRAGITRGQWIPPQALLLYKGDSGPILNLTKPQVLHHRCPNLTSEGA